MGWLNTPKLTECITTMAHISRTLIVPYSCEEMYQLVDGIEHYPQFIPWCHSSQVLSRTEGEIKATLCLARGGISKSFTTLNRNQKNKMIEIGLVHGPFKRLRGYWRFDSLGSDTGCKVSFDMEFEFAGPLVSLVFGPIFSQICNTLVDAFHKRAIALYGNRNLDKC